MAQLRIVLLLKPYNGGIRNKYKIAIYFLKLAGYMENRKVKKDIKKYVIIIATALYKYVYIIAF